MKLYQLLHDSSYRCLQGSLDPEITQIVYHSEKITKGSVFVCMKGALADGHDYAAAAAQKGAAAVICQKTLVLPPDVTVILTENTRRVMAEMAAVFYGYPAEALKTIGVTGTKGKTTTAYMIQAILKEAGQMCGLIGTVQIDTGVRCIESRHTTPESVEIQKYMREMADAGCRAAVMEVSSQAVKLDRTAGISFDIGVFTNLEADHIGPGEHKDFAEYAACKAKLFQQCKAGIVNGDDPKKELILKDVSCSVETYGFSDDCDVRCGSFDYVRLPGKLGVEFQLKGRYNISLVAGIPGRFSCYNAMAAVSVCKRLGASDGAFEKALRFISVPGRQEMFSVGPGKTIMVDYAHNGTALANLLSALRAYEPKRLTCVFGCGGQRDRNRRVKMAEAAAAYADFSVITSDNPRNEPPEHIIADICIEMKRRGADFTVVSDRREAIGYAVNRCMTGEIVVVAGKGHEQEQLIGEEKIHFDDREEVLAAIEKVKDEQNNFSRSL